MKPSGLYKLATAFSLASWLWLGINYWQPQHVPTLCFFKVATGFACPACGTTRSAMELAHGHWLDGIMINPFGVLALVFMVVVPLWLAYDFLGRRNSLWAAYGRVEKALKTQPWLYGPLILLALLNWYWNISKGV